VIFLGLQPSRSVFLIGRSHTFTPELIQENPRNSTILEFAISQSFEKGDHGGTAFVVLSIENPIRRSEEALGEIVEANDVGWKASRIGHSPSFQIVSYPTEDHAFSIGFRGTAAMTFPRFNPYRVRNRVFLAEGLYLSHVQVVELLEQVFLIGLAEVREK